MPRMLGLFHRIWTVFILFGLSSAACSQRQPAPALGGIYNRAAQQHASERNPVIVIPGILGSRLVDGPSQRVVWGAFRGGYANPETPDGARLVALPMAPGDPLSALRDNVASAGALDRLQVSLLGLPISLSAYRQLLQALGVGGYRDESLGESGSVDYGGAHYTCFQFDYDWRRDNVENARRLHAFIEDRRAYLLRARAERGETSSADVRFDIVAHSMGGLIARYYLMFGDADLPAEGGVPAPTWAGAARVDRLVMVGTPNSGSLWSFKYLVEGRRFAPTLPVYAPAVLGTMPSVYQLMPRTRHRPVSTPDGVPVADIFDVATWEKYDWGVLDPAQDRVLQVLLPDVTAPDQRRAVARDHLAKCLDRARQFHAALDQPAQPPPGLELHLFAGDAVSTPARAIVQPGRSRLEVTEDLPGDGTVLRASALADERMDGAWSPRLRTPVAWCGVTFLFTDHLGMTRDAAFVDNVLFLLLERP